MLRGQVLRAQVLRGQVPGAGSQGTGAGALGSGGREWETGRAHLEGTGAQSKEKASDREIPAQPLGASLMKGSPRISQILGSK